ncbi:hypothetical protein HNP38_000792 [Chryseobacterium defluvii]|uniref:PKD domain-containing protein n=1 Tax=Chryseobacterium defluvii TaxID=160396 RepID=A0A840KDA4_9FLAO|nr:PKD domain-containing protein [Chryseobacterium defluvii]MBB4805520.1 hypothetical protein [Chryseobacterium defluvii]
MKKIIFFLGLMLTIHIYAQSPLSKFNAIATGTNNVSFSNTSSGSSNSISWEFTGGNPSISSDPNPSVSYMTPGVYTAKLTVSNSFGSSISTRTVKVTAGNIIDLCSGRNDNGSQMADSGVSDPEWTYTDPNGVVSIPITRHALTGNANSAWSTATTGGIGNISRWITGNNIIFGDHYYVSKEFIIPEGVSTAVLNLRTLSFVRNWTYLVKYNTDNTTTETQITATTWASDGAKGWLNSRSPEVINYPLTPGKYRIKVKVYTNNSGQRQATDVNANVNFGNGFIFSPVAEFSATPTSTYVGSNLQFTNLSEGTPISSLWKFDDGANILTSTQSNPAIAFSTVGSHYAELTADYGNSLSSSLKINSYIQTIQLGTPAVSVIQPDCSVQTGTITVTSPTSGVTYSFDDGITYQSSNSKSGLTAGTYSVRVKTSDGAISDATGITVNAAPSVPAAPVVTVTQPTCTVSTGAITITSPSTGVEYSFDGGATYQSSNTKSGLAVGSYTLVVKNTGGCTSSITVTINAIDCRDWTKAPNSYVFDPGQNNDGLYIPVKKAYTMWRNQNGLLNDSSVLTGTVQAEVYWEDVAGLIRSANYILPTEGTGEDAKIKVEIDKAKGKGNAVVALRIGANIIWSWHVWVTDDPSNGATYGHVADDDATVPGVQAAKYIENGVTKSFTPKWMDRNLGATNKNFIGNDWNKSGGLSYQWGRKDPFPPFEFKDSSMYEVNGTIGTKKHLYDYTNAGSTEAVKLSQRPYDDINSNVKYVINNPLELISNDVIGGHAWFAKTVGTDAASRQLVDLWGDNSQNSTATSGGTVNTYKPKTSYDPCPNGWRIPSHLNNTPATTNHFSPWGRNRYRFTGTSSDVTSGYQNIKPTAVHPHLNGIKIYANLGMDFTNTTTSYSQGQFSRNMGVYPGSGKYIIRSNGQTFHQDPHEILLHSATITSLSGAQMYFFYAYGDAGQLGSSPDSTLYPGMKGRYYLHPFELTGSSATMACRCIEDKYMSTYNFQTEFFTNTSVADYKEGISNPNSYVITKSDAEQEVQIPISKAFSVYNQYLSDHSMLPYNNLKVNVYWTDNTSLVSNVKIINAPAGTQDIANSYISVKIPAHQSGNALVSLHQDNVTNPAYWSWHVWVSNNGIGEVSYQTEDVLLPANANYVNFTNSGSQPLKNIFMDRNLGAIDAFPTVANPDAATPEELAMIVNSGGLQYQWGRKDPIPSFIKPGVVASNGLQNTGTYSIWRSSGPDSNGNIYPSSYTELTGNSYENTYVKRRDVDYGTIGNTKTQKIQNNLRYSVENPLAYMIPNQKYTNRSEYNVAYGQDWLYSTPNQMMERWGHATAKSPFDPCPGGWRVPDISNGAVDNLGNGNKGYSPWYNGFYKPNPSADPYRIFSMGVLQNAGYEIKSPTDPYNGGTSFYQGSIVKNSTTAYGYMFNGTADTSNPNSKYKTGNYPITGYRGFANYDAISASMKLGLSGVWTAALRSVNSYGTGLNLAFETYNLSTSKVIALNDAYTNHPMNAMNVRCVRDATVFGQPLGTASNNGITVTNVSAKTRYTKAINADNAEANIEVYPNPFNSYISIKGEDLKYYELFDISGKLISQGDLKEKTLNLTHLIKGQYLLKIVSKEGKVTLKKIIKN